MTNQRMMTFVLNVQNEDGVVKTKEFRRSVADVDSTVEMLNSTLGENVSVTAKVVQSERDAVAQARQLVTQQQRQIKAVNRVTTQFQNMSKATTMSADAQQIFNAQVAAGVDPLSREGRQIAYTVTQYQNLRDAQMSTTGSMRNMRGVAQNLGWQMQDIAVQAQMGTNAFIILGQQGSQILSSFGAAGAIAGAGLAVVSAALPSIITALDDTAVSTDKVSEAQERLNDVLTISSSGVVTLTDDYYKLYQANEQLGRLKAQQAILDANIAMREAQKSAKELATELLEVDFDNVYTSLRTGVTIGKTVLQQLDSMAEKIGLNVEQTTELSNAYQSFMQSGNIQTFSDVIGQISLSAPNASEELQKLALAVNEGAFTTENYKSILEIVSSLLNGEVPEGVHNTTKATESMLKQYERMERQLTMTDRAIAVDNYLRKGALKDSKPQIEATVAQINAYYAEKKALDELNDKLEKETKNREAQGASLTKLTNQISNLQRRVSKDMFDPVAAELNNSASNTAKLQSYYKQLQEITDPVYKDAALVEMKRVNALIEDEEDRHSEAMMDAQIERANMFISTANMMSQSLTSTVDLWATGKADVEAQMEDMTTAQKTMFFVSQSIAAAQALINGIEMGTTLAKYAATYDWTGASSTSWIAAGTAIGAAQAGAIMGTTFAGAFDEGGYIPNGQMGIVSEYGDELVNGVLVKGPASVTGREDTARIMNNSTTSNNSSSVGGVTVIQNITANGDKAIENMVKTAATQGAKQGYDMMLNDLKSNGTGRKILRSSIGA